MERSANGTAAGRRWGHRSGCDVVLRHGLGRVGHQYFYRVLATSAGGTRRRRRWSARPPRPPPPPPATPAGVSAAAVSSSEIDVAWQDVAGESGLRVQRSPMGDWLGQVGTTGADVTAFSDTGLAASTTYYYRVLATSAGVTRRRRRWSVRPPMPATSAAAGDTGWGDGDRGVVVGGRCGLAGCGRGVRVRVQRSADGGPAVGRRWGPPVRT